MSIPFREYPWQKALQAAGLRVSVERSFEQTDGYAFELLVYDIVPPAVPGSKWSQSGRSTYSTLFVGHKQIRDGLVAGNAVEVFWSRNGGSSRHEIAKVRGKNADSVSASLLKRVVAYFKKNGSGTSRMKTTKTGVMTPTARAIIEGAARALFVQAYADWSDEHGKRGPGPGGDWMDYAPVTPKVAKDAAEGLIREIEQLNHTSIDFLYATALRLTQNPGGMKHARRPPSPDLFGHYLAMQSLGHGVSWFDDYPSFPLTLPHGEFHMTGRRDFHSSWSKKPRADAARLARRADR